jgi:hypothetical protein
LVDCKQQQLQDRKRSREERELVGKLRVFARFHSKEEHDALVEGLLRARKLRAQVELYCAYRSAGKAICLHEVWLIKYVRLCVDDCFNHCGYSPLHRNPNPRRDLHPGGSAGL